MLRNGIVELMSKGFAAQIWEPSTHAEAEVKLLKGPGISLSGLSSGRNLLRITGDCTISGNPERNRFNLKSGR